MKKDVVYLDNNSTTELSNEVSSVLMDITINNIYGNPSSLHSFGLKTKALIEAARYGVSESLGCLPSEIIFTSGGTEANNLAIKGSFIPGLGKPDELVVSAAEHSSVVNTAASFVPSSSIRLIPLTSAGDLDLEWAERLISEDTALVSVMLANNETGAIFQVKEIAKMAHKVGAMIHCDAVQAYGKIPIDVQDLQVDFLSISGHKAHALPGVGALYVRRGIRLNSLVSGGQQEFGLRAGTENYVGIASLGVVSSDCSHVNPDKVKGLRDSFEVGLVKRIPDITINASGVDRIPNTSSVTFHGIHASSMLEALADEGVYASAGSACASGTLEPSRTLISMGLSVEDALSTVRFSLSSLTKLSDVALAIEACVKCVNAFRADRS